MQRPPLRTLLPALSLCLLIGLVGFPAPRPQPAAGAANLQQTYLPLLLRPDHFLEDAPIWAHSAEPRPHEVVLFRFSFTLPEPLLAAELHLFADTRYQAWLDGGWLGGGPARFAQTYREYDIYPLGLLPAGDHTLAVLAQWAPEERRSESVRPLLQGHLEGNKPSGGRILWPTGPAWKTLLSNAWRSDAAPINDWGLIGPTELLDLRRLPADWFQPGFDDSTWQNAVIVSPKLAAPIQYRPRSIPFTVHTPVPLAVLQTGALSPGFRLGELPPGLTQAYNLPFRADLPTDFTIETLSENDAPPPGLILLDGNPLPWLAAGPTRPDTYRATLNLAPGSHLLTFNPSAADGLTFQISTANLSDYTLPFEQGPHAGRRLLLAEPVSQPGRVVITDTLGLALRFQTPPAYAILDLGRTVHGRLVAQADGPAGTIVDIGWDERLLPGTARPLPYPGSLHHSWNQTDSWVLDGNPRLLTTIDARAGRYILIAVWGEGPVRLENLQVYQETAPLLQAGQFSSSDPLLDQIWKIGADTVHLNMADAYMDPWRERGQWWGDAYVDDQVNAVTFGDLDLLRRGLFFMANALKESPAPGCAPHNNGLQMLDYAMLWVHSLADYARRSGDLAAPQTLFGALRRLMDNLAGFENPETGLIDLPKTHWSQTAYIEPLAYHSRYGQSTAVNALYYATLEQAADIARLLENRALADLWQSRAEEVKTSLNQLLYLPAEGRYATNLYRGLLYPPTPQAQAWALAYGLPPEGQSAVVASALLQSLSPNPAEPNLEIYGFFWVLEALGRAGFYQEAIDLTKNYYGRLIEAGATTWWEKFTSLESYANSLSHGWGSAPTWFLSTYILGARQAGPDRWIVQPAFEGVSYTAGTLPLASSSLQVSWQAGQCLPGASRRYGNLLISAPPGAHGEVRLPASLASIVLDGQTIWDNAVPLSPIISALPHPPEDQPLLSIPLQSGAHTLQLAWPCPSVSASAQP